MCGSTWKLFSLASSFGELCICRLETGFTTMQHPEEQVGFNVPNCWSTIKLAAHVDVLGQTKQLLSESDLPWTDSTMLLFSHFSASQTTDSNSIEIMCVTTKPKFKYSLELFLFSIKSIVDASSFPSCAQQWLPGNTGGDSTDKLHTQTVLSDEMSVFRTAWSLLLYILSSVLIRFWLILFYYINSSICDMKEVNSHFVE